MVFSVKLNMSRLVRKPTICIGENITAKLMSAFVFATRIVQFIFYFNPKFQASSSFLCLYRPVCVGPVQKPHCWFSHDAAHILNSEDCTVKTYKNRAVRSRQLSTNRYQQSPSFLKDP